MLKKGNEMKLYFNGDRKLLKASLEVANAAGASVYIETLESNTVAGEANVEGFFYEYGMSVGFAKVKVVKVLEVKKNKALAEIYDEKRIIELPSDFNIIIK